MASKKKKPSAGKSKRKASKAKKKPAKKKPAKKKPARKKSARRKKPPAKKKPAKRKTKKAAGKKAAKKKAVKKKPARKKKPSTKKKPPAGKPKKKKPAKKPLKKSTKKKSTPIIIPKRKKTHRLSRREQKVYSDLLTRRARLVEELKDKLAMDLHDDSLLDEGDLAARDTASDFLMALATIEGEEIKNIDDALRAIKEGAYGKCAACGEKIAVERLKALPSVKLCIRCKELEEQGKLF